MVEDKKIIFIACGQREDKEKKLGNEISVLVSSYKDLKPFLAEDTHSFEGLTAQIYNNLNKCSGFIAILHKRERCNKEDNFFRSSLWINQEIAIASFLVLRDKKDIPLRVFIESDENSNVKIEGVLEHIMVNPIPFAQDTEIIQTLKKWLGETKFSLSMEKEDYLLKSKRLITLLYGYTGDLHTYKLGFEIANMGEKTVRNISFEFYFPKGLSPQQVGSGFERFEPKEKNLKDFFGFRYINEIDKIVPGKIKSVYCFDFIVNHDIYFKGYTHKTMSWKLYAEDMKPVEDTAPLEGPAGEGINF